MAIYQVNEGRTVWLNDGKPDEVEVPEGKTFDMDPKKAAWLIADGAITEVKK